MIESLNSLQGEIGVLSYLAFEQNKITPSELSENIGVSLPREDIQE